VDQEPVASREIANYQEKEQEVFLRSVSIIRKANKKNSKKEIVKNDFSIIIIK